MTHSNSSVASHKGDSALRAGLALLISFYIRNHFKAVI
jgi:hypothetical protein